MQFFLLRDDNIRQNAIRYLQSLNIEGVLLEVHVKKHRRDRSTAQNRLMWAWYKILADYTGHASEDIHEMFKVRILGVDEKVVMGHKTIVVRSTTDLSVEEFTTFLNKIEEAAQLMGVRLPHPDDLYHEAMFSGRGKKKGTAA